MKAIPTKKAFHAVLSAVLLTTSFSFAQAPALAQAPAHDHEGMTYEEELKADAEIFERVGGEQKAYFDKLIENVMNGIPVDVATSVCTYISSNIPKNLPGKVTLTFDDGPSPYTPGILQVLARHKIKATFFMKGNQAQMYPEIVEQVRAAGHIVANHSYNHPDFHTLSVGDQAKQVISTDTILKSEMPKGLKLFRYPYGNSNCETSDLIHKLGYQGIIGWHIDSCDWAFQAGQGRVSKKQGDNCGVYEGVGPAIPGSEDLDKYGQPIPGSELRVDGYRTNYLKHILSTIQRYKGGIVLMHDVHEITAKNLEAVISGLEKMHMEFVPLSDKRMIPYRK